MPYDITFLLLLHMVVFSWDHFFWPTICCLTVSLQSLAYSIYLDFFVVCWLFYILAHLVKYLWHSNGLYHCDFFPSLLCWILEWKSASCSLWVTSIPLLVIAQSAEEEWLYTVFYLKCFSSFFLVFKLLWKYDNTFTGDLENTEQCYI